MRNLLDLLFRPHKSHKITVDELQLRHNNVQKWIEKEKPYQYMTEQDKAVLPTIGIIVNKVVRSGNEDESTRIFDRLFRANTLGEDLVVYRGVNSQDYEASLARKHNLDSNCLYYDGYIFCAMNIDSWYWNHKTRMIISVPAGSHYLFTGEYSNTPESDEIILDRNSILRVTKEADVGDKHYIWADLVNGV